MEKTHFHFVKNVGFSRLSTPEERIAALTVWGMENEMPGAFYPDVTLSFTEMTVLLLINEAQDWRDIYNVLAEEWLQKWPGDLNIGTPHIIWNNAYLKRNSWLPAIPYQTTFYPIDEEHTAEVTMLRYDIDAGPNGDFVYNVTFYGPHFDEGTTLNEITRRDFFRQVMLDFGDYDNAALLYSEMTASFS